MKPTYRKTITREIKNTFGRFVAIAAIVAIGVGFLTGILSTTPDMKYSMDRYYDANHYNDIHIQSSVGFTSENIEAIKNIAGVETAIPSYSTDVLMNTGGLTNQVVRLNGIDMNNAAADDAVNKLTLLEGRLPENAQECVILGNADSFDTYTIGETISISEDNDDYDIMSDTYANMTFTIVGLVSSPEYYSNVTEISSIGSGKVNAVIYVDEAAYALTDYTDLSILVTNAIDKTAFTAAYDKLVTPVHQSLSDFGQEVYQDLYDSNYEATKQLVDTGWETYQQEKSASNKQLDDDWNALNQLKKDIEEQEAYLADFEAQINETQASNDAAAAEYDAYKEATESALEEEEADLRAEKKQIDSVYGSIARGNAERDNAYINYQNKWDEFESRRTETLAEVAAQRTTIDETYEQLEADRQTLAEGQETLENMYSERDTRESNFISDSEAAEAYFAEQVKELEKAEHQLIILENGAWSIHTRDANASYSSYKSSANKIAAVGRVFPAFFFLVAALVSLTTMTRMIEEDREQLGMLKALGFSKRAIMAKYLIYCGLAAVIGCVGGLFLGYNLLPSLIIQAYGAMYHLPQFYPMIDPRYAGFACAAELICTVGLTAFVCSRRLKEDAASLMRPEAPKMGSRIFLEKITFIWKRMTFSQKSTARNILRYKRHCIMTFVGIVGCTTLLMAGFSFRTSISEARQIQYNEILNYDLTIGIGEDGIDTNLAYRLGDMPYLEVYEKSSSVVTDEGNLDVTIICPSEMADLTDYITLRDRLTKEALTLDNDSVIMSEKTATLLGLQPGDTFTITDNEFFSQQLTLTGITENYTGSYLYFNIEKLHGDYSANMLLANTAGTDNNTDEYLQQLIHLDTVSSARFISEDKAVMDILLDSLNYIVLVLVICAGVLAIVVLYNLTNLNIMERRKELATLRVLGYHMGEVAKYVFREAVIMSVISSIIGLGVGFLLERYIIIQIENHDLMFSRVIPWQCPVAAFVLTMIFALVVDLLMIPKLRGIQMADSMKAID